MEDAEEKAQYENANESVDDIPPIDATTCN
jgi:hypothetical protein